MDRRIKHAAMLPAAMSAVVVAVAARAQSIPEVDPTTTVTYGPGAQLMGGQISPDGATLYVQLTEEGINVWAMLVSLWPETLGAAAGLVTLALVIVIVRRLRSPQEPGAPHCRACGYNLRGHASKVHRPDTAPEGCPECGVNLIRRPPRAGRSALRRTWHLVALAVLAAASYGAMHAAGLPRNGSAAHWRVWRWPALDAYAEEKTWAWAQTFRAPSERIVSLDAATGALKRTLRTVARPGVLPMSLSPDGRTLVTSDGERGLVAFDAATGRRIRRHRAPPVKTAWWFRYDHIAGFSADSTTVYAVRADESDWNTKLIAWNYRTGGVETLDEAPAARVDTPRGKVPVCRRYLHLPRTDPPRFLSVTGFLEAYHTREYDVRVHGAGGPPVATIARFGSRYTLAAPVVDPTGGRFFISNGHRGLDGYDLRTGESLGTLMPPALETGWEHLAMSSDGRLLLWATVTTDAILVRDVRERRWAFRLRAADMLSPAVRTSADGGRVAAFAPLLQSRGGGPGGSNIVGVVVRVFDLPDPAAAAGRARNPDSAPE